MLAYTTELSIPLVGLSAEAVLAEVRRALADDERIKCVDQRMPDHARGQPDEHLVVAVWFLASSARTALQLVVELHDRALRQELAAAPADRGWTSDFAPPQPAPG